MAAISVLPPDGRVPAAADRPAADRLREEVRAGIERLLAEQPTTSTGPHGEARVRALIAERIAACQRQAVTANQPLLLAPDAVARWLFDEFLRYGPLSPLMEHPGCEEAMLVAGRRCFAVIDETKQLVPWVRFSSDEAVLALIRRLIGPLGKRLDATSPMVDCRLPDGSRLNAIMPPASTRWIYLTIRRFLARTRDLGDLVRLGAVSAVVAAFLEAAVRARVTMLVAGPTGSGKTTWVNALGGCIDPRERTCTIEEDAPELTLGDRLPDCLALVGRRDNSEGVGAISIRELVRTALRTRPQRILVGETRGPEALDLLLALTTGHPGSFSTIHAASPQEALDRLASLALLADARLSEAAVLRMVARCITIVLQLQEREEPDGRKTRWLDEVYEVTGLETGGGAPVITGNTLWSFEPRQGQLVWTGIAPRCLAQFARAGVSYTLPPVQEGSVA
jgi:pilus assembly protein CpaF